MSPSLSLSKVFKPQAGWYRGDFHTHTNFSDGYYSPRDLVEVAQSEGLDFIAITDHNTVDAFSKFDEVSDILVIPGLELTMKEGHYNVFGLEGAFDWLPDVCVWPGYLSHPSGPYDTPTQLMQHLAKQGLLNSINHPLLSPWDWLDYDTDLRYVHCLEIFNDPVWSDNDWANPQAVAMWTQWLNAGYRITAIGGTDYHTPQLKPGYKAPQRLGLASTYVYADELSGAAILAGVHQRRVYVTLGPKVIFQACLKGKTYEIGADLGEVDGALEFNGTVSHHSSVQLQLIKNGHVAARMALDDGNGALQYIDKSASTDSAWYRLDVLDEQAQIVAVTNPIYVGPQPEPSALTYGDFIEAKK